MVTVLSQNWTKWLKRPLHGPLYPRHSTSRLWSRSPIGNNEFRTGYEHVFTMQKEFLKVNPEDAYGGRASFRGVGSSNHRKDKKKLATSLRPTIDEEINNAFKESFAPNSRNRDDHNELDEEEARWLELMVRNDALTTSTTTSMLS